MNEILKVAQSEQEEILRRSAENLGYYKSNLPTFGELTGGRSLLELIECVGIKVTDPVALDAYLKYHPLQYQEEYGFYERHQGLDSVLFFVATVSGVATILTIVIGFYEEYLLWFSTPVFIVIFIGTIYCHIKISDAKQYIQKTNWVTCELCDLEKLKIKLDLELLSALNRLKELYPFVSFSIKFIPCELPNPILILVIRYCNEEYNILIDPKNVDP